MYRGQKYNNNEKNNLSNINNCELCLKKMGKLKYNYCNICKINICEECWHIHCEKYPNHNIKSDSQLTLQSKSNYCNGCGILINDKINLLNYNCNYCNGAFCNKCIISHYSLFPEHKYNYEKTNSKYPISFSKCHICKNSINNETDFYCHHCKIILCKKCINTHNNQFPSHNIIIIKKYLKQLNDNNNKKSDNIDKSKENNYYTQLENSNRDINCSCSMCQIPHSKYPTRLYYNCADCNYICSLCQKRHDNKFYSHILINPHRFGDEFRKLNRAKSVQKRFATIGSKRKIEDREDIELENDNSKVFRNESVGRRKIIGKNACYECKQIKKLDKCDKCKRFYCQKCIKVGQHIC